MIEELEHELKGIPYGIADFKAGDGACECVNFIRLVGIPGCQKRGQSRKKKEVNCYAKRDAVRH